MHIEILDNEIYMPHKNGQYRFHYGGSLGYETFETFDAMYSRILPWLANRTKVISKELLEMSAIQNQLLGITKIK